MEDSDRDEPADPIREARARVGELEAALKHERQRSTALEHRADYLEAALKRSYAMAAAAPRVHDRPRGRTPNTEDGC